MTRPLTLCDLDFTDLRSEDDKDDLAPRGFGDCVPPPPPPSGMAPPPMLKPMAPPSNLVPPPMYKQANGQNKNDLNGTNSIKKTKKTVSVLAC